MDLKWGPRPGQGNCSKLPSLLEAGHEAILRLGAWKVVGRERERCTAMRPPPGSRHQKLRLSEAHRREGHFIVHHCYDPHAIVLPGRFWVVPGYLPSIVTIAEGSMHI